MLTLVKTCGIFSMTERIDWKDIQKKVVGVKDDKGYIYRIHFNNKNRETFIFAKQFSEEIYICTIYKNNLNTLLENDYESVKLIMESSGNGKIRSMKYKSDYIVFKKDIHGQIDSIISEYKLRVEGFDVTFVPDIIEDLIIKHMDVVWNIVSGKGIFAIMYGDVLKRRFCQNTIDKSWEVIVQYILIQ